MWEAGAIAFDRVDDWSDVDLQVASDDERVEDVFAVVEDTLRPLVHALRIPHDPTRHNFHTRYVHYDFPEEDVKRLSELFFVAGAGELAAKRERAERWFHDILEVIHDGPFSDDVLRAVARSQGGGVDDDRHGNVAPHLHQ